ncbi:PQQ-binding-like beta-propeller repeat protein [Streptomyces sp. NBC_00624]|uniref:outer membrane protein assembly factor BamB family protein n=1 Tax=Streptomyces sp. NBC_00624 TaxID=2975791 RepID=UPI0038676E90
MSFPTTFAYFIPASKSSNQLVALDTQSNKPLWRAETAGSVTSDPVITSTHVYVVTNTGSVIAYDKRTGKETRRTPQDPRTAGQDPPHSACSSTRNASSSPTAGASDSSTCPPPANPHK